MISQGHCSNISAVIGACVFLTSPLANAGTDPTESTGDIPIVITPTRIKQSQADAPASVTVITSEFLKRYGVRSVVEAMRFVPGMQVTMADGNQYQVNYHGSNALNPRRMNVMLNNVSLYQVTIAEVRWDTVPVSMDDIERIEIIRGPDSASYGPNSMMAVVNIITKHPIDVAGWFVAADVGTNNNSRATLRYGGTTSGGTTYRLSLEHYESGGFDLSSGTVARPSFNNDLRTNRFSLSTVMPLGERTEMRTEAALWGAVRGFSRVETNALTPSPLETNAGYLSASVNHQLSADHEISFRGYFASNHQAQEWRTGYPQASLLPQMFAMWQANPTYAPAILAGRVPSGGTAGDDALAQTAIQAIAALGPAARQLAFATVNQDFVENRLELEMQDSNVFSPTLRTVAGFGLRLNRGSSETYFGGSVFNSVLWGFGNVEYRLGKRSTLNAGAYVENSRLGAPAIAPRAALNFKVDEFQSLRFVVSHGFRSPDIHEQKSNWTYTFRDVTPVQFEGARLYQSAISTEFLGNEHITSYEIGYFKRAPQYGLTFDIKGFYEHLYHLISERLSLSTFFPTNNGQVNLSGVEFQVNAELSPGWGVFATYAHVNNDAPQGSTERTQYAKDTGSIGITHRFQNNVRVSANFAYQSSEVPLTNPYGRFDINLSKSFIVGSRNVELTAGFRRFDSRDNIWIRGTTPVYYAYPSRYQALVGVRCAF
ncbi:MAG: TonB-dependent receptor [Burkholderiales bacterium]|nr:TonB-dependent receptor [Burkholderiales bacterium]